MRHYNIPIFMPEQACPFRCIYCNQYSIASQHKTTSISEVKKIVESHLDSFTATDRYVEVAFFGGNFTGLPVELQDAYLDVVQPYIAGGQVQSIRCSTRPDYVSSTRLKQLKAKGMLHIELGAQSTDDDILRICRRGHSSETIRQASQMILDEGLVLGLQMMTGLPHDTLEKSMKTAEDIVSLGASETRIYPCIVVRNTALEQLFRKGEFTPLTICEAVDRSAKLFSYFQQHNVTVLRIGLHQSADLNEGAYIAGPYHPNFAEMVFSRIWSDRFDTISLPDRKIEIEVSPSQLNHAAGWNADNRNRLLKRYDEVRFSGNASLLPDEWIAKPLVSKARQPRLIIADSRMPSEAKAKLESFGKVLWLEPTDFVYQSISAHPDIYFFKTENGLVAARNTPTQWLSVLKENGIKVIPGSSNVGNDHPQTTRFNAATVGTTLVHNLRFTDETVRSLYKNNIHVNQGYTRCNLASVGHNSCITSDKGIFETLTGKGFNVFFVDPSPVVLPGHRNGFFPGCCGLFGKTLFVCGSLDCIPEKKELLAWLSKRRIEVVELYNGPLADVGGIFMLK